MTAVTAPECAPEWQVDAVYFAPYQSREQYVTLRLERGPSAELWLLAQAAKTGATLDRAPLAKVQLEPPLLGLPRRLEWPSGGRAATDNHAGIEELDRLRGMQLRGGINAGEMMGRTGRFITRLESRWSLALLSVVFMAAFAAWVVLDGLPRLAGVAARQTPPAVLHSFDEKTLEILQNEENDLLSASKLSKERQRQLTALFNDAAAELGGPNTPYRYNLLLRHGGEEVGANAFALPGGTVVLTDQLVKQAFEDLPPKLAKEGIAGVLAHEIGHVEKRHSLQGIYQSLGLGLLAATVTGDVVSASSVAVAAPTFFIQQGYSRRAEYEADKYGGQYAMHKYGSTEGLRKLLVQLEGWALEEDESLEGEAADEAAKTEGSGWEELLYTHPDTAHRVERLEEMERGGASHQR